MKQKEFKKRSTCIHCKRLKYLVFKDLPLDEEQVRKNLALRRKNELFLTVILEGSEYSGLKKVIRNLILKGPKAQYQSPQKNYVSHKIFLKDVLVLE